MDQIEIAGQIVEKYKELVGKSATVGDLLCDLMLYCNKNNVDFETECDYAHRHFVAERTN